MRGQYTMLTTARTYLDLPFHIKVPIWMWEDMAKDIKEQIELNTMVLLDDFVEGEIACRYCYHTNILTIQYEPKECHAS